MARTKKVPRSINSNNVIDNGYRLRYYDNIAKEYRMGKRKNNKLYAYIYRKLNKRYADNKTNRKKK